MVGQNWTFSRCGHNYWHIFIFFYTMFFIVWATYFYDLFKSATFLKGNSETVQICPTPVHICPTLFIFLNIKKANKANYHVFERNPVYTWDLPLFDPHCIFCKVSHSDFGGQYEKKRVHNCPTPLYRLSGLVFIL